MSREIKFRCFWFLSKTMQYEIEKTYDWEFMPLDTMKGKDCALMQYTGLKDKNGKEIYEGDVINGGMYNGSYCHGKVVFNNGAFTAYPIPRFTEGQSDFMYILNQIEVIGNIYENPELLK
jgi:uncharacterized phage protein (TIGR01671 family)